MESKNDCHRKILIKKDFKFFSLFLKTMKLENEIKSPVPAGLLDLGRHSAFQVQIFLYYYSREKKTR